MEQIAGDLMPAPDGKEVNVEGIVATGFLSIGPRLIAEQDKPKMLYDFIDEQIDTTTRGILGLTVACARCHDHKFDPIATADYYSLAAIFANTKAFSKIGTGGVSDIYYAPLAPADVVLLWNVQQSKLANQRRRINAVLDEEIERRQAPSASAHCRIHDGDAASGKGCRTGSRGARALDEVPHTGQRPESSPDALAQGDGRE